MRQQSDIVEALGAAYHVVEHALAVRCHPALTVQPNAGELRETLRGDVVRIVRQGGGGCHMRARQIHQRIVVAPHAQMACQIKRDLAHQQFRAGAGGRVSPLTIDASSLRCENQRALWLAAPAPDQRLRPCQRRAEQLMVVRVVGGSGCW